MSGNTQHLIMCDYWNHYVCLLPHHCIYPLFSVLSLKMFLLLVWVTPPPYFPQLGSISQDNSILLARNFPGHNVGWLFHLLNRRKGNQKRETFPTLSLLKNLSSRALLVFPKHSLFGQDIPCTCAVAHRHLSVI